MHCKVCDVLITEKSEYKLWDENDGFCRRCLTISLDALREPYEEWTPEKPWEKHFVKRIMPDSDE